MSRASISIEEAAERVRAYKPPYSDPWLKDLQEQIAQNIEQSSGVIGWVKCSDRLPPIARRVLCAFLSYNDKFHVLDVSCLTAENMWLGSGAEYYELSRVTHWRELPAPPDES